MTESSFSPPAERVCERCGRREVWGADDGAWKIAGNGAGDLPGEPFCIHEWDLTGSYNAFAGGD